MAQASNNNRVIRLGDIYCCLLPQCEAMHTFCSAFPQATKWCCSLDVKALPDSTYTKRDFIYCKKVGILLHPLSRCGVKCAIHHKRGMC